MSHERNEESPVACTVGADGIAVVDMRDETGRNALSEAFVESLTAAIDRAVADTAAKVIVLVGGREVFSAGARCARRARRKTCCAGSSTAASCRPTSGFRDVCWPCRCR